MGITLPFSFPAFVEKEEGYFLISMKITPKRNQKRWLEEKRKCPTSRAILGWAVCCRKGGGVILVVQGASGHVVAGRK
jgi:hypothetical protein